MKMNGKLSEENLLTVKNKLSIYQNSRMFGITQQNSEYISWYVCRDSFRAFVFGQNLKIRRPKLYYVVPDNTSVEQNIAKIISNLAKLEERMGLKNSITVERTDVPRCILISLKRFWTVKFRFDFLTAFIKSSSPRKSFDQTVNTGFYFNRTKNAVKMFIDGRSKFKGRFYGWVRTFSNKTPQQLKQMLGD